MARFWGTSLSIHMLIWLALTAVAYTTAGPYTFASCWPIIPIYYPPFQFAIIAVASCSSIVLLIAAYRPSIRAGSCFLLACPE